MMRPRRYQLALSRGAARVERLGPATPLQVGIGRRAAEAPALAKLLFPICPVAQGLAALKAAEAALGVMVEPNATRAREALSLAEAIAGCVWRQGLNWPNLLAAPPATDAVRTARAAAATVESALFVDRWDRLGGGAVRADQKALQAAAASFRRAFAAVSGIEGDLQSSVQTHGLDLSNTLSPPLGEAIEHPGLSPEDASFEESPRSNGDGTGGAIHSDPFAAQAAHGRTLLARFEELIESLQEAEPAPPASTGSGAGLGVVMTARGRLRHAMTVEDGVVVAWSAAAPTDWNLAPNGALARTAAAYGDQLDERAAPFLIAAFDPCAPCEAVFEKCAAETRESAYA